MSAMDDNPKPKMDAKAKIDSKPVVENKPGVKSQKRSPIIMIGIGALIIVVLGVSVFFATPYIKAKFAKKKPPPEEVKATLLLDAFLVNLADKDEIRFLKTTFQLGLAEEPKEEAKSPVAIAAIRDTIITLLSSKTAEQVLTSQGKDKLREEIRSRIRVVAPSVKVLEVYIVDFVVQL